MFALLHSLTMFVIDFFKSPRRLEAENLFLRHQLSIALRCAPPRLRGSDRALLVWMTRRWPSLLGAVQVVQPETILRWHRAGFTAFWRWKSRQRAGRPTAAPLDGTPVRLFVSGGSAIASFWSEERCQKTFGAGDYRAGWYLLSAPPANAGLAHPSP